MGASYSKEFRRTSEEKTINLIYMKIEEKKRSVSAIKISSQRRDLELLKLIPSALKPIYLHTVPAFHCKIHINIAFWLVLWYFSPCSSFMWQQDLNTKFAEIHCSIRFMRLSVCHYVCLFILFLSHLLFVEFSVIDGWLMLTCWEFFLNTYLVIGEMVYTF